jgi:tripartite-type tricarboxylate transporter receptor subunit TctC
MFLQSAQIEVNEVGYRGGGPAIQAVLAGEAGMLFMPAAAVMSFIQSGDFRPLAATTRGHSPLAPDVPTVAESGMEPLEMVSWYGLWGPKDMDPALVRELARRVGVVTASAKFRERLEALGFVPRATTPEGLRAFVEKEIAQYRPIVEAAKIRVE